MPKIIIIGAGLTGLSTAYHLNSDYIIYEKENEIGGLCRSYEIDGFIFDYTGHLLHCNTDYIRNLIQTLLPNELNELQRNAYIYSQNVYTDYPFQANLYGLPAEIIKECLLGFIELFTNPPKALTENSSFKDWVLNNFGKGIAKYFMFPYNEKLWQLPLSEMTSDWVWTVPRPNLEEVVGGALGLSKTDFGYNPSFFYPKDAGIRILPNSLSNNLSNIYLNHKAISIDEKKHQINFQNGKSIDYTHLVSTMPLPELINILQYIPQSLKEEAKKLAYLSVYCVNIGVNRNIPNKHWIYIPEKKFPFYRVGFYSNFNSTIAPKGTSSMYIEISRLPNTKKLEDEEILFQVCNGLEEMGILYNDDIILTAQVIKIDYAYVIYNKHRQRLLPILQDYLNKNKIYSIGRYGAWEYSSMKDALMSGKKMAELIG